MNSLIRKTIHLVRKNALITLYISWVIVLIGAMIVWS